MKLNLTVSVPLAPAKRAAPHGWETNYLRLAVAMERVANRLDAGRTVGEARRLDLDLWEPPDVAKQLGVSEKTLAKWRSEHRGPAFVKVEGGPRYPGKSLRTYISELEHRQEHQEEQRRTRRRA